MDANTDEQQLGVPSSVIDNCGEMTSNSVMQQLLYDAHGATTLSQSKHRRNPKLTALDRHNRRNYMDTLRQHSLVGGCDIDPWDATEAGVFSRNLCGSSMNGFAAQMYSGMSVLPQLQTLCLRCPECGIIKMNSEEMELHIKIEHVVWMPFQCNYCGVERAADYQMREHMLSVHRKNSNKFSYFDNPNAKRMLQILMDRCLLNASHSNTMGAMHVHPQTIQHVAPNDQIRERRNMRAHEGNISDHSVTSINSGDQSPSHLIGTSEQKVPISTVVTATAVPRKKNPKDSCPPVSFDTNTDAVLSAILVATEQKNGTENSNHDIVHVDQFTASSSSKSLKSDFDIDQGANSCDEALIAGNESTRDCSAILGNVSALFTAEEMRKRRRGANGVYSSGRSKMNASSLLKKRVIGECSKCKKPVTAGARQMHMFFHLGKDHNIYRFKCKYPDCTVEHYRKDQMENHQTKQHGLFDLKMMEDRSAELLTACQELSMELLGTTSNAPGPTAAKAQIIYDALAEAQAIKARKKRRSVHDKTVPRAIIPAVVEQLNDHHSLDCRACGKPITNKVRGFHILWHMAKDLGINRYKCTECDFGSDRSQSVQTHGRREHNTENCVEDKIEDFSDEVKAMSEMCFGFQTVFSPSCRKKAKFAINKENSVISDLPVNGECFNNEFDANLSVALAESPVQEEGAISSDITEEQVDAPDTSDESASKSRQATATAYRDKIRKTRNRRFGMRKAPPKSKRKEMAKLRELSMRLGGAQYFKKRINEAAHCQKCGMLTTRMSDHAYKHLNINLFLCPLCSSGNYSRELVVKHIRDVHNSQKYPIDERMKYRIHVKEIIRECYPAYFVDAPMPTLEEIEKLKSNLHFDEKFSSTITSDHGEADKDQAGTSALLDHVKEEVDVDGFEENGDEDTNNDGDYDDDEDSDDDGNEVYNGDCGNDDHGDEADAIVGDEENMSKNRLKSHRKNDQKNHGEKSHSDDGSSCRNSNGPEIQSDSEEFEETLEAKNTEMDDETEL